MEAESSIARFFCLAGGALLVFGLVLWGALPIHLSLPPYLFTAALALGYGIYVWKSSRPAIPSTTVDEKKESRE